jgi:hypothetical protein|tara:strand:- start:232 stop:537 length:306 start_codon:yes stop_codon:yes gene_type:complete
MNKEYSSFDAFYPFYLSQHQHKTCRRLHFLGSLFILLLTLYSASTAQFKLLFFIPLIGYGFAWVGHFIFERNRPATFTYPLYSLIGDWVMFKDILIGKIKF